MAREHYITQAILKDLATTGVEIRGLRHQEPAATDVVPTKELVGKVLCERHNNALSPFDDQGLRLYRAIVANQAEPGAVTGTARSWPFSLFAGEDVERWILKTLCATVASGVSPVRDALPDAAPGWQPPHHWLDILFRGRPFPPRAGLWVAFPTDGVVGISRRVACDVLASGSKVSGLIVQLGGVILMLAMNGPPRRLSDHFELFYRPAQLVFTGGRTRRVIHFSYDNGHRGEVLHIEKRQGHPVDLASTPMSTPHPTPEGRRPEAKAPHATIPDEPSASNARPHQLDPHLAAGAPCTSS